MRQKKIRQIKDVPKHYALVSCDIDIKDTLLSVGLTMEQIRAADYSGLFVEVENGEYKNIFGFNGIPFDNDYLFHII